MIHQLRHCTCAFGLLFLMILLVGHVCTAQPRIEIVGDTLIDYGRIYAGERVSRTVRIHNAGTEVLVIDHVNAPCNCSQTQLTSKRIAPNDSAILTVTFNSELYNGRVTKFVNIVSNDLSHRNAFIHLRAEVVPILVATPEVLRFDRIRPNTPTSRTFRLTNNDTIAFNILSVFDPAGFVGVRSDKRRLGPGDSIALTSEIVVPDERQFIGAIEIVTDHPQVPIVKLTYVVQGTRTSSPKR